MRVGTCIDQIGSYAVKTCSRKFDLCVGFITFLNAFVLVLARAHAIPRISSKGLHEAFKTQQLISDFLVFSGSLW